MDSTPSEVPGSSSQSLFEEGINSETAALQREYQEVMHRAQGILNRCRDLRINTGDFTPSLFTGYSSSPTQNNAGNNQQTTPEGPTRSRDRMASDSAAGLTTIIPPERPTTALPPADPRGLNANANTVLHLMEGPRGGNPFLINNQQQHPNTEVMRAAQPPHSNQCKNIIFDLERKLMLYKNIEYDIYYLKSCVHHGIVPQGLRFYRFPNGISRDMNIFSELVKLYNDTGLTTLNLLIDHNQGRLNQLKEELHKLQDQALKHQDFENYRHTFDGISPRITRHVATLVFRKQKKLNRDLQQYGNNQAYRLKNERQNRPTPVTTGPTNDVRPGHDMVAMPLETQDAPRPPMAARPNPPNPPPQAPPNGASPQNLPAEQVFALNQQPFLWQGNTTGQPPNWNQQHRGRGQRRGSGYYRGRRQNSTRWAQVGRPMATRSSTRGY